MRPVFTRHVPSDSGTDTHPVFCHFQNSYLNCLNAIAVIANIFTCSCSTEFLTDTYSCSGLSGKLQQTNDKAFPHARGSNWLRKDSYVFFLLLFCVQHPPAVMNVVKGDKQEWQGRTPGAWVQKQLWERGMLLGAVQRQGSGAFREKEGQYSSDMPGMLSPAYRQHGATLLSCIDLELMQ